MPGFRCIFLDNEDLLSGNMYLPTMRINGLTITACDDLLLQRRFGNGKKNSGWPPDIIHCSGWMTGPVPFYLKTVYKKNQCLPQQSNLYHRAKHFTTSWTTTS
jgi:starch synthase